MMAFEFLGGRAHCGAAWHRYGVTEALGSTAPTTGRAAPARRRDVLSYGSPAAATTPGLADVQGLAGPAR